MAKTTEAQSTAADVLVLGEHPATYLAAALLQQQPGKSGRPLRVVHVQIPDARLPSAKRLVLVSPKLFELHESFEGLRRKLNLTAIYGIRFLGDDPPTASEHKARAAVAHVATYEEVRAAAMKLAEGEGVELIAPDAIDIQSLDEKGAIVRVDQRQVRPKVLLLGGKLSDSHQKMLGLPESWERDVVHRFTFLRLKSSATKSVDLGNRPSMPMSLDLCGKLCWAWFMPPHDGHAQIAVEQPIESVNEMPPKTLLKHWAKVLQRHGVLKSDGDQLPIESDAESVDLPLSGALAHEDVANRTLLIGPAGGFYSATGEDIYPNCWSAVFAAEILKKALRETHLQDALQSYRHKWRTTLGDYLRGPQQNLRYLLPLVYRNQRMTDRIAEAILWGKSVVR